MIFIRKFRAKDLPQVMDIASKSFREIYTQDFFIRMWELSPETFLVAESMNKVVGFIIGVMEIGSARILMLSVAPSYRRMGIGTTLLKSFLERVNKERVTLEVRAKNRGTINFYLNRGFKIKESLPNFYSDDSDGLLMEKIS